MQWQEWYKTRMKAKKKKHKKRIFPVFMVTFLATLSIGAVMLLASWALVDVDEIREAGVLAENGTVQGDESGAGSGVILENGNLTENAAAEENETLTENGVDEDDKSIQKEVLSTSSDEITLAFAGDILFDDQYAIMAKMKERGQGIEGSISGELLEEMRGADIFMVNNEFTYTDRGEPTEGKAFTFRAKPEHASLLLDMGADIVSLANNHAYDYGEVSLTDTIDTLSGMGMPFVGAGYNIDQAASPFYFDINGQRIAFIAATQIERLDNPDTKGATADSPGVFRCLDPSRLLEVIRQTKEISDYVVVYIHWGTEGTDELDWAQNDQAPRIAEAGADLIIGNHPHVLQGISYIGNTPVVYSLGNFLFNSKPLDTCLIKVKLDENGFKSLQFLPARQEDCSVRLHTGSEKTRVLEYMRSISTNVNIDDEGFVTKK